MSSVTLPLPPTDGSHPHAQPVHYARPNAYTNTSTAWQEEFRLLLLEVAHSPRLRREIDLGAPAEDSTFATRREFEDVMKAQEAIHQARKAGKKIVAQNTRPLEKPGTAPIHKRVRQYEPTGNPKGRPRKNSAAGGRVPVLYRDKPCSMCSALFTPTSSLSKYCDACRVVAHAEAKKTQNAKRNQRRRENGRSDNHRRTAKTATTITCLDCGEIVPRTGRVHKRCAPCAKRAKDGYVEAHAPIPCIVCGEMMQPKMPGNRFCTNKCYCRWQRAEAKKKQAIEANQ